MNAEIGNSYGDTYYKSHYGRIIDDPNYYDLMAEYWKHVLFSRPGVDFTGSVLDYGSGIGQVSAALPNVLLSDPSTYATEFAHKRGKAIVTSLDQIPHDAFDIVLSSHALEHSPNPADDLVRFTKYVKKPGGKLVLLLPSELEMYRATNPLKTPRLEPDLHDQHFQCWTFQTITNLLAYCGWRSVYQEKIYGPFLLNTLARKLPAKAAVHWSHRLGRLKKGYPSLLTIAELRP